MRDYGVVSPKFWIGETGKALRGNAPAQVLALYLMTCPHANMIGVFHCPVLYMAHETGLGMEGASKALQSLIESQYCTYDEASETVFVHRMAAYQVAETLKPGDNRVKGVEREWSNIGPAQLKSAFAAIYSVAFHLPIEPKNSSPLQGPSEPLASQDHEQDHEQEEEAKASLSPGKPDAVPSCPHTELIDLFGQHLPMLPQPKVEAWGGARAKALQSRWRWVLTAKKRDGARYATNRAEALDWFTRFFGYVARSDFLTGRDSKWTGCDLGWLANETNFAKVIQGNYDNRELEAA